MKEYFINNKNEKNILIISILVINMSDPPGLDIAADFTSRSYRWFIIDQAQCIRRIKDKGRL